MGIADQLDELNNLLKQKRIPADDKFWDAFDVITNAQTALLLSDHPNQKQQANLEKSAMYVRQIISGDIRKIEEFEKFVKAHFKNETRKELLEFCIEARHRFDNHIDLEMKGNQYVKVVEQNFGHPSDRIETVSGVGVVEVRGQRPYQEDAVLVDRDNAELLAKLDERERKLVQTQAIASLQETVKDSGFVGSTVNLTTAWTEEKEGKKNLRISNSNIGDSTAFIIILDKDGNVTKAKLVNKLHNSDNPEEKERVEKENGFFTQQGRVLAQGGSGVAVTRDIGGIEAKGLSRDPEITEDTIRIPPGGRVFVVAACDGLTERNLDEEKIGEIVAAKANAGASPSAIAQELMNVAYQQGSEDNISVMVAEVDRPITLGIFDGHGGDIVSKKIAREMPQALMKAMKISKPDVNAVKEVAKEKKADALVKRTEDLYKKQAKNLQAQILKQIAIMLKDPNLKETLQAAGITSQSSAAEIMQQILTEISPPPGIPVDSLLLRLSEPFPTLITDYKTAVDKINILGHARYTSGEKLITLKQKLEEERIDKYLAMDVAEVRKVDLLKPGSFSRSLNSAVATSSLVKDTTDFYDDFYGKNISDIENFPDYPGANLKLQHEFFSVFDEQGHLSSEVKFDPDPRLDREPEPNFKGVTKSQRMKLEKFIQSSFSKAQSILFDQGELRPWVYQKYGKTNIDRAISALGKEVVHSQLMAALLVQMSAGTMPDKYEKGGKFKGYVNTLIGSQALLNDRFVGAYVKFKKAAGADLHGPAFERLEDLSEAFYKKLQKNPCLDSGNFAAILALSDEVLKLKGTPDFDKAVTNLEREVREFNRLANHPKELAKLTEGVAAQVKQYKNLGDIKNLLPKVKDLDELKGLINQLDRLKKNSNLDPEFFPAVEAELIKKANTMAASYMENMAEYAHTPNYKTAVDLRSEIINISEDKISELPNKLKQLKEVTGSASDVSEQYNTKIREVGDALASRQLNNSDSLAKFYNTVLTTKDYEALPLMNLIVQVNAIKLDFPDAVVALQAIAKNYNQSTPLTRSFVIADINGLSSLFATLKKQTSAPRDPEKFSELCQTLKNTLDNNVAFNSHHLKIAIDDQIISSAKSQLTEHEDIVKKAAQLGIKTDDYYQLKVKIAQQAKIIRSIERPLDSDKLSKLDKAVKELNELSKKNNEFLSQVKTAGELRNPYSLNAMKARMQFSPENKQKISQALDKERVDLVGRMTDKAGIKGEFLEYPKAIKETARKVTPVEANENELKQLGMNARAHEAKSVFDDKGEFQPWVFENMKLSEAAKKELAVVLSDIFKKASVLAYDKDGNLRRWIKDYIEEQVPGAFQQIQNKFPLDILRPQMLNAILMPISMGLEEKNSNDTHKFLVVFSNQIINQQLSSIRNFTEELIEFRKLMQTPEFAQSEAWNSLLARAEQMQIDVSSNPARDVSKFHPIFVALKNPPNDVDSFLKLCTAYQQLKKEGIILKEIEKIILTSGDELQKKMLAPFQKPAGEQEEVQLLETERKEAKEMANQVSIELRSALNRESINVEELERIKSATVKLKDAMGVYNYHVKNIEANENVLKGFAERINAVEGTELKAAAVNYFNPILKELMSAEVKPATIFNSLAAMDQLLDGVNKLAITANSKADDKLAQTVYAEAKALLMNVLKNPTPDIKHIRALAEIIKASGEAIEEKLPNSIPKLGAALKAVVVSKESKKLLSAATQLHRRGPHKEPKVKQEVQKKIEAVNAPKLDEVKPHSRRTR